MASCPDCQTELPPFSLHCVQCGRAVVPDTMRDDDTVERLRSLANARRTDTSASSTLMGSPHQPQTSEEMRTLPEGALDEARLAALADAPLDDRTLREASSPPAQPTPGPPSLVRLSGVEDEVLVQDKGRPARRRSDAPEAGRPPSRPPGRSRMPGVGEIIEGYQIEAEIGRGGMGRVYRAIHEVTGQTVALKMLLPKLVDDERLKSRFINEAKVLARLEHPNLVPLLGFLEAGRRAFIVMPYVEGLTLEQLLRTRGRLPFAEAADLFDQMCRGISHVHAHDVMHRDLKPANVIVRTDGRACITDFGIARALGSEKLTMTGMVVGTAEYLSPEQASGTARDDLRSDVYSLGILLYEMLTGRVPFRHPSAAQVLMKHVQAPPPPPRTIVPQLSTSVEDALLKALEKEPADRYESVEALRLAVAEAFSVADDTTEAPTSPPVAAPPPVHAVSARPPSRRKGRALVGQIVLGAALGGGLAALVWFLVARRG